MTERKHDLTGFRIPAETVNKLRFIAHQEIDTLNHIGELALSEYVDRYEKKNGPITEEQLQKIISKSKAGKK